MGRWIKGSLLSVEGSLPGPKRGSWKVKKEKKKKNQKTKKTSVASPSESGAGHGVDARIERPQHLAAQPSLAALFSAPTARLHRPWSYDRPSLYHHTV